MHVPTRSTWVAYGAAALLVLAALAIAALKFGAEARHVAHAVFYLAVLACTLLAGVGPGLVAAVGGSLAEAVVAQPGPVTPILVHALLALGSAATGWGLGKATRIGQTSAEIAARERAEQELVYSQNLLRTVFDTLPLSVLVKDREGRYVMVNRTWCERYGLDPAKVIGQTTQDLPGRPGPDRDRAFQEDQAVFTRGVTVEFNGLGTGKPGEPRHFHTIKTPLRDVDGAITGLVGVVVDTTEGKRVEDELRASQRLLRTTIDTIPHNLFVKDLQGRHLLVNQTFCETLRLVEENIIGHTVDALGVLQPADLEQTHAEDRQVLAGHPLTIPVYSRQFHGSREARYFQAVKAPLKNETGGIVGLVGLAIEVTNEVKARQEVEAVQARFAEAIESLPAALFMFDAQERLVLWNSLTLAFLPEIAGQLAPGMTFREVLHYAAQNRVIAASSDVEGWIERRLAEFRNNPGTFEQKWSDGRWIQGIDRRMSDGGTICLRFDITEAKQREDQLRQSQKLEAVGHLAGGIAHDFNNMLTIIRSYAEFIVRSPESLLKSKEDAKIISQTSVRAAALTQQLLAFSRRQVLRMEELGINRVVTDMEVMLRRLIGEHIEFATALDAGLHSIKADPSQMEQVILNLVVNSRDAMPKGGRLLIETANVVLDGDYAQTHTEVAPGRYVMLAVSDSGVGIEEETQKHIFEPFFTTKPPGEGSGMGLATVYGIVKQMKGFVFVYSELGRGTTFKLYFPDSGGVVRVAAHAGVDADVTSANGETILLVEDEELVRRSAARILSEAQYVVLEAKDVHDAIRIAGTHPGPIDIMLTDVVMPAMSGQELWERVREMRPMRVVFMSGYTDDAVVRHGVLAGDVPFVAKPFTRQGLLAKLRETLDSPRAQGQS